jgi:hypothetical protein
VLDMLRSDDLADLRDRVPELVVGAVVVRAEADPGVRAEVAEDLALHQLAVHRRELGHPDRHRSAPSLRLSRASNLEAGGVGEVDQQLRLAQGVLPATF